jgi:RHS repeat-associated protein
MTYAYNPDGSRATMAWSSGGTTVASWTYGYDSGGRLTSVANSFSETTSWGYDGEDKLTSQANQNNTAAAYGYFQLRGFPYSTTWQSGGTTFASYLMYYDGATSSPYYFSVGNLTNVTEFGGSTETYTYDALYRMSNEVRTGTNAFTHGHGYDLAGNRGTYDSTSFTYDNANKLTQVGGVSQTNDADGNQTGLTYPNSASFTYDDLNRLTSQTSGGVTISYAYDGLGRRVYSSSAADGTRYYVYDGDLVIGEVTASGETVVPAVVYTWGANGLVSERLLTGTPRSLWYHFGPQGETRQLTDSNGTVADTYLYTAYGEPVATTGTDRNPYRYGGQFGYYTGPDAGIVLCGARWYNPYTARWMTRDPIEYDGGENLYGYCGENPVRRVDPSGLQGLTSPQTPAGYQLELELAQEEARDSFGGLIRLTSRWAKPIRWMEQHHVFPRSLANRFTRIFGRNFNVNRYCTKMPDWFHSWVGRGPNGWWQKTWKAWLDANPQATPMQTMRQLRAMLNEIGLRDLRLRELMPYK